MYKNKKIACVIPSRMSSSRFPNKPLAMINGRELILRVADAAKKCKHFDRIIIATEDLVIKSRVESEGYEAWMTGSHYTCNHRVSEVASDLDCDYVFLLQGEEFSQPIRLIDFHLVHIMFYNVNPSLYLLDRYLESFHHP